MTVRDIFGLLVRVAGLVLILFGLLDGVGAILHIIGLSPHPESTAARAAAAGAAYLLVGALAIILAEPITRLAYGSEKASDGQRG